MNADELTALYKRIDALEHEFGEIMHQINEATREVMKARSEADSSEEIMSVARVSYDLANAARQGRAIEGLMAVMRYLVSEAAKGAGHE